MNEADDIKAPGAPREAGPGDNGSAASPRPAEPEAPSASEASGEQPNASEAVDDAPPTDALEQARAEAAQYLDDLRRLKAEFENYRKRVIKEQTQVVEYATQQMIERVLPVLDNFELALLASDRTKDYEKLVRGVELVFGELVEILRKEGLQRIEAHGAAFDPALHEAVLEADGRPDGEPFVAEVMRPGYRLKGRVIRPAMVKVERR